MFYYDTESCQNSIQVVWIYILTLFFFSSLLVDMHYVHSSFLPHASTLKMLFRFSDHNYSSRNISGFLDKNVSLQTTDLGDLCQLSPQKSVDSMLLFLSLFCSLFCWRGHPSPTHPLFWMLLCLLFFFFFFSFCILPSYFLFIALLPWSNHWMFLSKIQPQLPYNHLC